jgi:hypothetical protein
MVTVTDTHFFGAHSTARMSANDRVRARIDELVAEAATWGWGHGSGLHQADATQGQQGRAIRL